MMHLLTLQLDDLGTGRGPVLAVLAIVLAAILMVMLRDLFVWFEALGDDAGLIEDEDEAIAAEAIETPQLTLASSPFDRRSAINAATGFGRRHTDVLVVPQPKAA